MKHHESGLKNVSIAHTSFGELETMTVWRSSNVFKIVQKFKNTKEVVAGRLLFVAETETEIYGYEVCVYDKEFGLIERQIVKDVDEYIKCLQ